MMMFDLAYKPEPLKFDSKGHAVDYYGNTVDRPKSKRIS